MSDNATPNPSEEKLTAARDEFVNHWGSMGSAWGINRTMAQIHAFLMTSSEPLSTDQIMDELQISRGNANTNLRDLVGWGLIKSTFRKGERKEYFESEKDVWKMFCIIARERNRREITPAKGVLADCAAQTKGLKSKEAKEFNKMISEMLDLIGLGEKVLGRIAASEKSTIAKIAAKLLS